MKKKLLTLMGSICLILVLVALLLPACAKEEVPVTPAPAAPEVIHWKHAYFSAAGGVFSIGHQAALDDIERLSNGRLVIKPFWGSALGKSTELLSVVASGIADSAQINAPYFVGELPLSCINTVPFIHPKRVDQQMMAFQELCLTKELEDEFTKQNVVFGWFQQQPGYNLIGNVPIRKVEDFKGVKVKTYGMTPEMFKAFGAIPVECPIGEMFTSLQTGLVDLNSCGLALSKGYKFYEVSKYYIENMNYCYGGNSNLINKDSWDALPQDIKDIFPQARYDAAKQNQWLWCAPENRRELEELHKAAGVEFIEFPEEERAKMVAASKDCVTAWVEKWKDRGAEKALENYLKIVREVVAQYPEGLK